MKFFKDGLDADEVKIFSLVSTMVIVIISCLVSYFIFGTIDNSLLALADSLIYSVAGVHIVKGVANAITSRNASANSVTNEIENNKGDDKDNNAKV